MALSSKKNFLPHAKGHIMEESKNYKISRKAREPMEPQRSRRNTLCPQEKRSKGRDIARWKIDSLVEDEVILRDGGIIH